MGDHASGRRDGRLGVRGVPNGAGNQGSVELSAFGEFRRGLSDHTSW